LNQNFLSSAISMLSIFQSSFSTEYLLVCLTSSGVLLATLYYLFCLNRKKLPPLAKGGLLKTMRTLSAGKANPAFYLEKMKELGVVFRISMPDLVAHWVIVCDGALTRKLLMEESQKASFMQRFVGLTSGTQTIFTQSTNSSWHTARKGVAPSFSMRNVSLSLPWIYAMTDKLKNILATHQSDKSTVDVPKMMTHFTLDLICAGMTNTIA
jgi:cytochrome P450